MQNGECATNQNVQTLCEFTNSDSLVFLYDIGCYMLRAVVDHPTHASLAILSLPSQNALYQLQNIGILIRLSQYACCNMYLLSLAVFPNFTQNFKGYRCSRFSGIF